MYSFDIKPVWLGEAVVARVILACSWRLVILYEAFDTLSYVDSSRKRSVHAIPACRIYGKELRLIYQYT